MLMPVLVLVSGGVTASLRRHQTAVDLADCVVKSLYSEDAHNLRDVLTTKRAVLCQKEPA